MADKNLHGSAVANAMSKTLEALAFMELFPLYDDDFNPVDDPDITPVESIVWARIPFVRPVTGSITIALSPELANNLTDVIYGFFEEGNVTDELMMDAVAEVANVLAGRFFSEILPKGVAFELGLPSKGKEDSIDNIPETEDDHFSLDFSLEGQKFTVMLAGNSFEIS